MLTILIQSSSALAINCDANKTECRISECKPGISLTGGESNSLECSKKSTRFPSATWGDCKRTAQALIKQNSSHSTRYHTNHISGYKAIFTDSSKTYEEVLALQQNRGNKGFTLRLVY